MDFGALLSTLATASRIGTVVNFVRKQRKKMRTRRNNHINQTHQNTDKEQLSLEIGSKSYNAYVNPDDSLEEVNPYKSKDVTEDALDDVDNFSQDDENPSKTSTMLRMQKVGMFDELKSAAIDKAESTPDKTDDIAAARLQEADAAVAKLETDDSVSANGYIPKFLRKYM